jgi:hypothetical protein
LPHHGVEARSAGQIDLTTELDPGHRVAVHQLDIAAAESRRAVRCPGGGRRLSVQGVADGWSFPR